MFDKIKSELNTYKMYRSNKDEIRDYLFKSNYGSECEACLDFTTLLEREQHDGVCRDCYKSGTINCKQCGATVYMTQIDFDCVCDECRYTNDQLYDSTYFINTDGLNDFIDLVKKG